MKFLLIAPESFEFSYPVDKISTTSRTINEVLTELKAKEVHVLIIPAEQTIISCTNTSFSGIELIKHIRLTPELKEINKLPIVLLHWHNIDCYIAKDQENIFLYSPGIYKYRFPHCKIDFDSLTKFKLDKSLTPYLFGSENDESISDHVFRNEIAIKQFEQQVNNPVVELFDKELWFKKIFYKNFGNKEWSLSERVEPIKVPIRILFADDMAEKWKTPLKRILPNATFTFAKTEEEITTILMDAKKAKDTIIVNFESEVISFQKLQEAANSDSEALSAIIKKSTELTSNLKNIEIKLKSKDEENQKQETAFKKLVQRLSDNGGLIEAMIGNLETSSITDQNKKDAHELSESIRHVLSFRNDYNNSKSQLAKLNEELARTNTALPIARTTRDESNKNKRAIFSKIEQLFSDLFQPEFDLILLDIHFSQGDKNTSIKESVGYNVLLELKKHGFKIPVILFSASVQNIEQELGDINYGFLRFIKGITPVLTFREQILSSYNNIEINKQIEVIEQLKNYSKYYIRKYNSNDMPDYDNLFMDNQKERDTKQKLQSISNKLSELTRNTLAPKGTQSQNQILIEITQLLGIIQENRLVLPHQSKDNSFWYGPNLTINRIGSDEDFLRKTRNSASHTQTDAWKNKIDISLIKNLITTTYKRLMLG